MTAMHFPLQPRDEDGPLFAEPWQAQAFSLVLALHERGLFSWQEWADELSGAIASAQAAGDPDLGDTYYEHWLAALEQLVAKKGLADEQELQSRSDLWKRAYLATPHGKPVLLASAHSRKSE